MYDRHSHYRAFLAITPTEDVRAQIRDLNRKFKKYGRNFRFTPLDQLHSTLQFLGNSVSGDSITMIEENISPIVLELQGFTVRLDKLNFGFPGQNIATHSFLSIDEESELNSLTKLIHENIKSLGLIDVNKKKDHSKLINHMTIARVKGHSNRGFTREIIEFIETLKQQPLELVVSEVKIITSIYVDNSTKYSELVSMGLKKGEN